MNKLFKNLILPLYAFLSVGAFAQDQHFNCGLSKKLEELYASDPSLEDDQFKMLQNARQVKYEKGLKSTVYTIPIVFHIIHQYGAENISDAQVFNQVAILNRDFNLKNSDTADIVPEFKSLRANPSIQFKLATIDPSGNCTNGIEHIYSHETNEGDDNSKLNGWHRDKYLNVWVVSSMENGVAGYAFYPSSVDGAGFIRDGVIILDNFIGNIGTSSERNSRALTHEIGHWLGLPHVWGNNNNPGERCGDDEIEDTPVTKGHSGKTTPWTLKELRTAGCTFSTTSSYSFNDVTLTSGKMDPTTVPQSTQRINFGAFNAVGVSSNSINAGRFSFNNWPLGGSAANNDTVYSKLSGNIDVNKYYEVTISPKANRFANLDSIYFVFQRSATGPRSYAVRSSIDNFASNIVPSSKNSKIKIKNDSFYSLKDTANALEGSYLALEPAYFSDLTSPITFRIYAWNAEDYLGSFSIDDFKIIDADSIVENIQNYMEYSYTSNMFTLDQSDVMRSNLLSDVSGRSNLITAANHTATGIDLTSPSPCVPVPDFKASKHSVCQGSTVQFTDVSWRAAVTSRTWTFEGGTPETSTDPNVIVTYNTSGYKKVTLLVSNESGSNEVVREKYIFVSDPWANYTGPASNNLDNDKSYWFLTENEEDNEAKFQLSYGNGYQNTNCFKLNNFKDISSAYKYTDEWFYNRRLGGSKDAIITPSFDLSHTSGIKFSFKYAYATNGTILNTVYEADGKTVKYAADITEEINIWVSKDCGATWGSKKTIPKSSLLTAGFAGNSDFKPTSDNQWKTYEMNYSALSADKYTRFKIEFVASDVSNNFYVDDINVEGVLGLIPNEINDLDLSIYPNPISSQQSINVSYVAGENPVELILRDIQGQLVHSEKINEVNTQVNHTLELGKPLSASCYFLEVKTGEYSTIKKVVVL
jgi:PKD repeat protein